ncbi:LacI family transcriptional regulator [Mycetocola tolaasinivorans]|uniref:LacI family transcriptional regulator n=1 Tax=Mycetocola tolaasinivorans TaxID=76635 RepID=A0A3L7A7A7_9MICO|nr:LacI family DNA-binding transcriptional regulator [Mycetocola tolaasinivorans]RLP76014.1 LacI family transcriptional regulator [Mycetocola tolaasinivorans]
MKPPTVYDVAERAGVSIATVSRVLRSPNRVRPDTAARVEAAVRELGYVPSGAARGLAERRTGVLGLYLPGFDAIEELTEIELPETGGTDIVSDLGRSADDHVADLYFDEVVRGAELEAWRRGYALMVAVGRGENSVQTFTDMAGRVDGLIVLARAVPDAVLTPLAARIPVVVLSARGDYEAFDRVSVSNREGMAALTDHVLAHTTGEIVYLGGPEESPDARDRRRGVRDALEKHGRTEDVRWMSEIFTRDTGRRVGRELVRAAASGEPLPGAVLCGNDQMALGVLDEFTAAGIAVPERVLVSGFDGIPAAALSSPRLSTVRQPIEDLGRAAIALLDERFQAPNGEPRGVRLPVSVLLRESTAPSV